MKKVFSLGAVGAFCAAASVLVGMGLAGCKSSQVGGASVRTPQVEPAPGNEPAAMVLKASVFKMSGDYGNNVAVTLLPDGRLSYFPAPTDLSADSAPVEIGDGWWLNRQGLGPNSVFTKWTFDEYRALKTVPTPEEIKAAIIPGATVTEFHTLPIPASEANSMQVDKLRSLL